MNYYNPYFYNIPNAAASASSPGLLKSLFGKGINWGSLLTNTQKVIGIANQAIPVVKQISPVMQNAKTMFKVMNEFKKVDTPTKGLNRNSVQKNDTVDSNSNVSANTGNVYENVEEVAQSVTDDNGPSFFI
ncbi:MAG: VrrA/YqfQ family protein [Bacilli bacterium]|nr:VrrA/YqfQ family protein [Bacilli bacterium]